MKKLELEIRKNGFIYRQVWRNDACAIYEQFKDGKSWGYEVFKVKTHKGYTIGGNDIPAGESFPSNESFGTIAWTANTLERAFEVRDEIISGKRGKIAESTPA